MQFFAMSGWAFALTVVTIQIFSPMISSFSTVYRHSSSGRKLFGGYRIVPKSCVSTAKDGPKAGICMFNYECTHRGGILIGSCVDGFLFGACCSLPSSQLLAITSIQNEDVKQDEVNNDLYINTKGPEENVYINTVYPTSSSRTSPSTLRESGSGSLATTKPHRTTGVFINNVYTVAEHTTTSPADDLSKEATAEPKPILEQYLNNNQGGYIDNSGFLPIDKYPGADTILLNPDGTIVEENFDPETEFTLPESHQTVNPFTITDTYQKSTSTKIQAMTETPNMNLVTFNYVSNKDSSSTTPFPTMKPLAKTESPMNNLITKISTTLLNEPSTSSMVSNQNDKLTTVSLLYKHTNPYAPNFENRPSGQDLVLVPTIEHKNDAKTSKPKPTQSSLSGQYDYTQSNQIHLGSESTSINHIIGLLHDNEPKPEPEPIAVEKVTSGPPPLSTWVSVQDKPWKKTTPSPGKKPGTSGVINVHGPSITVDGSSDIAAPTVIVIPPPEMHQTTHSSVSVPLITKYPSKKPQIITSSQSGFYLTQKPSPLVVTATSGPSSPGQETLINFPPVRNPDLNVSSSNQVEKPTIVENGTPGNGGSVSLPNGLITALEVIDDTEINTIDPDEDYDEFTTPELVDEKVGDKVHTFVEKIVNSLAGNFQDLENVLFKNENASKITNENGIELNNVHIGDSTEPSKRPASEVTTKKPSKKTTTEAPTTAAPVKITKKTTTTKKPTTVSTTLTTKRPIVQFGVTTKKPVTKPVKTPTTLPPTKKPTTTTTTTKKPTTTTKKPVTKRPKPTTTTTTTTKRPRTTTQAIEYDEVTEPSDSEISTLLSQLNEDGAAADFRTECGVRPLYNKKNGRIVGGKGSEFGSYPWQVLVRESTWLGLFTKNKCGGVLITNKYVITAAHCQPGFLASLVAVFGEFDISGELESKRSLSKNVRRVIVHRQYDPATFENDLAVLELDSPIQYDEHIVPICMPREGEDFVGRMATVTGWGRLKYGGGVPSVLQEVNVPLIENSVCQEMFQTAGHQKRILGSFLCAGYANGQKDSCEGDSGGPLMVERDDGHWALLGTVSHGIKCAAPYLPGVYMRTTYYKPWLKSVTSVQN